MSDVAGLAQYGSTGVIIALVCLVGYQAKLISEITEVMSKHTSAIAALTEWLKETLPLLIERRSRIDPYPYERRDQ